MQCGEARHWTAGDTTPAVAGDRERLPRSVMPTECSTAYCGTIDASRNEPRAPLPRLSFGTAPDASALGPVDATAAGPGCGVRLALHAGMLARAGIRSVDRP